MNPSLAPLALLSQRPSSRPSIWLYRFELCLCQWRKVGEHQPNPHWLHFVEAEMPGLTTSVSLWFSVTALSACCLSDYTCCGYFCQAAAVGKRGWVMLVKHCCSECGHIAWAQCMHTAHGAP